MYRRSIYIITLIILLLLCGCESNPVKRIKYYPIEATIESVYDGKVILEYGGEVSVIEDKELYDYCMERIGETIPATLVAAFTVNHQVGYRIMPCLKGDEE